MGGVATIAAGRPFAEILARELLRRHGAEGDDRLADAMVLLPTRRAVRSLTAAFLRVGEGRALLLPAIQPLGDIDDDEPAMLSPERHAEAEIPPAIAPISRQMLLARMISQANAAPDVASALGLAQSLAALIDEVATERLDFAALAGLAPERFQAHWQNTIRFLKIATHAWPELLAARGEIDPAARRDRLTARLAAHWRATPPDGPVWIAGSTGSVPSTAELMATVCALPQGLIVLPGLDGALDESDREAALHEAAHPQHGMLRLLGKLGVAVADVAEIGGEAPRTGRQVLLAEALRPANTTEKWSDLRHIGGDALEGLSLIEARTPREEAAVIAIRLREVLETPGKTAALVTPERDLARRVVSEMTRFGVAIDDSAGAPLRLTRAGGFLQLAAVALGGGCAPVDLLALLKHPLASGGMATAGFRREVRRLERFRLRGLRRYERLDDLVAGLDEDTSPGPRHGPAPDWLRELSDAAARFAEADGDFRAALTAQVAICEWLAASDETPGAERLWRGDDGEAAATGIADLLQAADDAPQVAPETWPAMFDRLLGGNLVRPRFGRHARLTILGPLEARLQRFDVTILGGLNEKTWPASTGRDPWMSRQMRAAFGLPPPEWRAGLQSHDFAQLAASGRVILTRSLKAGGAPTVASRWLLRLKSVAKGAGLRLACDETALHWARRLDESPDPTPAPAPTPCPPVASRPKKLPVTAIETLIRDPYAVYARRILKLRPLDAIDEQPGPMRKGIIMHDAFEQLARRHPGPWSLGLWDELQQIGDDILTREKLPPAWRALWLRRFLSAAKWLLNTEAARGEAVVRRWAECTGEITGLPELPDFILTAKADRLDEMADGGIVILDYKTGQPPSKKEVESGFAVQLPLTALILSEKGFADVSPGPVSELVHIRVHGAAEGGEWKPVKKAPAELMAAARDDVSRLLKAFEDQKTPYRSRPSVKFAGHFGGDYDHLARAREWSVVGGEEEES